MARAHRVPNNIRALRKERGLTIEQLADRLGVHFTTLAKIEKAQRGLSLDMLSSVSRVLGVLPIDIIGDIRPSKFQLRMVPLLVGIEAAEWRANIHDPEGSMPIPSVAAGDDTFALQIPDGTMDKFVGPDAIVVIDPDDIELKEGKVYAVLDGAGKSTFRRFLADPMRLEPVATDEAQQEIMVGREPFTIIGRAIWQISRL